MEATKTKVYYSALNLRMRRDLVCLAVLIASEDGSLHMAKVNWPAVRKLGENAGLLEPIIRSLESRFERAACGKDLRRLYHIYRRDLQLTQPTELPEAETMGDSMARLYAEHTKTN